MAQVNIYGEEIGPLTSGIPMLVSALPAAGNTGTRLFVSDSNQTMTAGVGAVVAGGGGNPVPVFDDGTNWRIG